MSDITLSDNTERHRYEAHKAGELAGYCEYNLLGDGSILFSHTEVLAAFEGQGVGSALARHVLGESRRLGRPVIPVCQFIAGYIRKHPEYLDTVRADARKAFV